MDSRFAGYISAFQLKLTKAGLGELQEYQVNPLPPSDAVRKQKKKYFRGTF